jgi:hypothetical protein
MIPRKSGSAPLCRTTAELRPRDIVDGASIKVKGDDTTASGAPHPPGAADA